MNCKNTDSLGEAQRMKKAEDKLKGLIRCAQARLNSGSTYAYVHEALEAATTQAAILAVMEG